MANRRYNQYMYSMHVKPVSITAKWTVLATNGAGVTGFAGQGAGGFGAANSANTSFGGGIASVTGYSSSPASGNNMLQGNVLINFSDNYTGLYGMSYNIVSPVTGSAVLLTTGLSLGQVYQITTVGTSTAANWQAVGLPVGITPAVGVAFQASTASAGTGTGAVKATACSQLDTIEFVGDPNFTLAPVTQSSVGFGGSPGGYVLLNMYKTVTLQQPTDGTIVAVTFLFNAR